MATESDSLKPASDSGAPSPELRLLDRRAFVGFPPLPLTPGLAIADFALQIPDVTFPFNVSAGPSRYQRKKLLFGFLELTLDADLVARKVAELAGIGRAGAPSVDRCLPCEARCAREDASRRYSEIARRGAVQCCLRSGGARLPLPWSHLYVRRGSGGAILWG
jgi:hypothetical protein